MTVDLSWHVPLRIIHSHIFGDLNHKHLYLHLQDISTYLNEAIAPVHLIIDDRFVNNLEQSNIDSFQDLSLVNIEGFEKIEWVVNIGERGILSQLLFSRCIPLGQVGFMSVQSIDEALSKLSALDQSLVIDKAG